MKFYHVKNFVDALFSALVICIFCYFILNYFLIRAVAIIFSVCTFSLSLIFFFARFQRKNQDLKSKRLLLTQTQNLAFWLSTAKKEVVLKESLNAILSNGIKAEIKNEAIFLPEEKRYLFLLLPPDGLKKTHLVNAYNTLVNDETALLVDEEKNPDIISYAQNFSSKISVADVSALFPFLGNDFILSLKTVFPLSKAPLFKNFFAKKRAKNFFVFGIIFLLLSFISPIKLYYVISGAVFLSFSAIAKIYGKTD